MNSTLMFRVAFLALAFGLARPLEAQIGMVRGSFDRALSVTGAVELDVRSGSGDIHVRQGPDGTVRVIGRIEARGSRRGLSADERVRRIEAMPPIEQLGGTIRVGDVGDPGVQERTTINYEVTVPARTTVRARSGSGDLIVDGVSGPVAAATGSGDIRIGDAQGSIEVSAGSGDIEIGRVGGSLSATTGSGSIRAQSVAGAIRARTGSGNVIVAQTAMGEIEVTAGSGDITVTGAQGALRVHASSGDVVVDGQPRQPWELEASSGDVLVRLPDTAGFELAARSSSGRIDSRHPITVTGTISRRELRGRVREGGPVLNVRTSSGGIRIE
jgi:hypothetical protein